MSRAKLLFAWKWAVYSANGPKNKTDRQVAMVLHMYFDSDGQGAWPSQAVIAARALITRQSVVKALARLERDGWIVRTERMATRKAPAHRLGHEYQAKLPPDLAARFFIDPKADAFTGRSDSGIGKPRLHKSDQEICKPRLHKSAKSASSEPKREARRLMSTSTLDLCKPGLQDLLHRTHQLKAPPANQLATELALVGEEGQGKSGAADEVRALPELPGLLDFEAETLRLMDLLQGFAVREYRA